MTDQEYLKDQISAILVAAFGKNKDNKYKTSTGHLNYNEIQSDIMAVIDDLIW